MRGVGITFFCLSVFVIGFAVLSGFFVVSESGAQVRPLLPKYESALRLSFDELWGILKIKAELDMWDASIIADDGKNTYLGKIASKYESDSIFHKYGEHGSDFGGRSIWSAYGDYGSKFSNYSAFNKHTASPPYIVKDGTVIGRLTLNDSVPGAISPYLLKALFPNEVD